MGRRILVGSLLLCCCASSSPAQDKAALKDTVALQETIQQVVQRAEPSVASIVVSRSDIYSRLDPKDKPPADNPGKLGGFERRPAPPMMQPPPFGRRRFWRGDFTPPRDETAKYDLADRDYVPAAYGSGVVLDAEKLLVLTNYHVIVDATKIYVRLPSGKGS
jgi:S1-C subfamily serine protease